MGPFGSSLTGLLSEDSGFKLYGQENTISGDFAKGTRWISSTQFEDLKYYQLMPGDLVLTRKGSIGNCKLVPEGIATGIADSDTIRVRLKRELVLDKLVVILLQDSSYVKCQIDAVRRGAILSGLNTDTVANLQLVVPPIKEQHSILSFITERPNEVDSIISNASKGIEFLSEYRTALITEAVTGKLSIS
jgi:type I restriction enzyme S subunit